jgi:hypothetical protein
VPWKHYCLFRSKFVNNFERPLFFLTGLNEIKQKYTLQIIVLWDVMPCNLVDGHCCIGKTCGLHFHSRPVFYPGHICILWIIFYPDGWGMMSLLNTSTYLPKYKASQPRRPQSSQSPLRDSQISQLYKFQCLHQQNWSLCHTDYLVPCRKPVNITHS